MHFCFSGCALFVTALQIRILLKAEIFQGQLSPCPSGVYGKIHMQTRKEVYYTAQRTIVSNKIKIFGLINLVIG